MREKGERGRYEPGWVQMCVLSLPLFSRPDMYENAVVEATSRYISARLTSDRRHQGHRDYGWAADGTKRVSDALSMWKHPLTTHKVDTASLWPCLHCNPLQHIHTVPGKTSPRGE